MSSKNEQGATDVKQKNVYQKPLHQHSAPKTAAPSSTIKPGFCTSSSPIAALLTSSFLKSAGLSDTPVGSKFCIPAADWKKIADKGDDVPKVKLECTHEEALKTVGLEVLQRFAADQENSRGVERPSDNVSGTAGKFRESNEIGGKEPKA